MSKDLRIATVLKQAAGNAPWHTLNCPDCNVTATSYVSNDRYWWSLKLKCPECKRTWWVCTRCENQRAHLKDVSSATRHDKRKHQGEGGDLKPAARATSQPLMSSASIQPAFTIPDQFFSRQESPRHFQEEMTLPGKDVVTQQDCHSL